MGADVDMMSYSNSQTSSVERRDSSLSNSIDSYGEGGSGGFHSGGSGSKEGSSLTRE